MPFITHPLSPDNLPVVPLWINGAAHAASEDDNLFPVISSVQDKPVHYAVSVSPKTAALAVESAASALVQWRKTTPAHRRALILKAADVLEKKGKEVMQAQMTETSCAEAFAQFNLRSTEWIREVASATTELRGVVAQNASGEGGEDVVVKASELCPLTHHLLLEAFEEAGIPPGVINMIQARREDAAAVTEAIVAHKALRKVDFIGSAAVGSKIGQLCAKYLKPVLMELGGKGPALVLEDADLEQAAKLCAMGAVADHGQLCFSTERIIVHRAIYDDFVKHLTAVFSHIPGAGDAVTRQSAKASRTTEGIGRANFFFDAKENGATFLAGGLQFISETSLKPTLVTNVSRNARIFDEETFGPSATVYMAQNDEDAVAKANDSAYGLNAAVHSRSWEHAFEMAKQLEYGQVHINNVTCTDAPGVPIKGVKGSGWGNFQ
ncbi:uncharacterized protein N0V89_009801 [Didymosphaeria variabile]|uniref:Aldehyde dehydrogenase domain-containing protein n=1 Tax=Didymosphaeria variabile TaxID=1932322 RepID=A0A9W8XE67_9PLEO|nr:uncharacterized protein N0V89_009801 [Didymosphaeria variabile]KAJ4348427.1 hypothetical protein N0V89_009801 [Didymosphaeria variabile]